MFYTRFLSPTDQKCAESSTHWQFFYYRPLAKFRFTHLGEIVKMLCQELDIHIYVYIYMMLLIIGMDFLYQFNLGLIAPLFSFSSCKVWKKKFLKIFKSWQVCDWLAKWMIMLRFMDLRWPRVYRRSNVGLVYHIFRGCVPEMFVTSYSVTYCIYVPGKPGICFQYYCALYDECK